MWLWPSKCAPQSPRSRGFRPPPGTISAVPDIVSLLSRAVVMVFKESRIFGVPQVNSSPVCYWILSIALYYNGIIQDILFSAIRLNSAAGLVGGVSSPIPLMRQSLTQESAKHTTSRWQKRRDVYILSNFGTLDTSRAFVAVQEYPR